VLGQGLFRQILVTATLIATVSLAAGLLADRSGEHVQSWVFVTLGLAQLGVALALRAPRHGLDLRSRSLEAAVLVAAALQVLGTSWAPLRSLLGTEPVAAGDLLVLVALATLPGLLIVGQRLLARARVGT
jgi:Ca2+-transporting ATPase